MLYARVKVGRNKLHGHPIFDMVPCVTFKGAIQTDGPGIWTVPHGRPRPGARLRLDDTRMARLRRIVVDGPVEKHSRCKQSASGRSPSIEACPSRSARTDVRARASSTRICAGG